MLYPTELRGLSASILAVKPFKLNPFRNKKRPLPGEVKGVRGLRLAMILFLLFIDRSSRGLAGKSFYSYFIIIALLLIYIMQSACQPSKNKTKTL